MKVAKNSFLEVVRFGLVGVFATLLHYGLYWLLSHWINYNIAYTIGYGLSFVCNFFLTSYFTFKSKATIKRGIGFSGAHLFNYLFQMLLLNVFIHIGVNQTMAPIPVYAIAIPVNFLMVRFVFKHNEKK
jgi:putative flippase GtrA